MNRIAFTARTVKGLSEFEIASELGISEASYSELELELARMTPEMAEKLEDFYGVPSEYFMVDGFNNIKVSIEALERSKKIIESSGISNISIPAETHISLAKMGIDALIARQEQIIMMKQIMELERENAALRTLYENAKSIK
ncbi:MAG: helix-turn-helix transcriptional regulator [Flavisolibacter sp.]|nr:helix-turn-helix transcriptional regulator [Flavisolibacter sp.]